MKDTYLNAKLVQPDLLRLIVFSSLPWEKIEPVLVTDGVPGPKMKPTRLNTLSSLAITDFRLDAPLKLGHSYFFVMPQYGSVPVDVTESTTFEGFDEKYAYDGDDLGATYTKKATSFAIWAPLASRVVLGYRDKRSDPFVPVTMIRTDRGVYRVTLPGDHEGAEYHFLITNSEITRETTDPYAKASAPNGEHSVVVDWSKLKPHFNRVCLPIIQSATEAVIYETHVRDFTVHGATDIVHKGQFLGMVEPGRKTVGGHPAGLDYLKELGITHVQLLPIFDYKTVDERNPSSGYNWGYDPAQYFVPEGSYASHVEDPLSRIRDCQAMVGEFHKAGIRVVMDVVYNHVYEYERSVFEAVVPNYYFRHKFNGKMANTSWCGDDLASERAMVRKLIIDACKWWIDVYSIDGFRFDLMGIIDVDTLKSIADYALAKDKSFLLYGEGWNMGGEVKQPLGHMENFRMMPEYGFFNDAFREAAKKLFLGDYGVYPTMKNGMVGSCADFHVPARFLSAAQSINYVECHDNATYFDFLSKCRSDYTTQQKLSAVEASAKLVIFSLGVPFLHMGEEIGLSKHGEENSYNKGDYFNQFDYKLLDERYDMAMRIAASIKLRRKLRALQIFDRRVIEESTNVDEVGGCLHLAFLGGNLIAPRKGLDIYVNHTLDPKTIPLPSGASSLLEEIPMTKGEDEKEYATIPPLSLAIFETL